MDYVLSPLAEADLDELWQHIAYDNEPAADGMIFKIFEAIDLLVRTPFAGRAREELLLDIRSFGVHPYVIFYRPTSEEIEIVRVLHGARDIESLFH